MLYHKGFTVEPHLTNTLSSRRHDIMNNSDCPSILNQPLNSHHPATLYNGQFSHFQLYASNTDLVDTRRQDCPLLLLELTT